MRINISFSPPVLRLYLAILALTTQEALVRVVVSPFMEQAGLGLEAVGMLISLFAVASLVSRLPSGILYRRRRAQVLLRAALVTSAIGSLLYPIATDVTLIVLARLLGGIGFGIASTAALAAVMDLRAEGGLHRQLAAYATVMVAGYATGLGLGGAIADLAGFAATFSTAALLALVGAVVVPPLGAGRARSRPLTQPPPSRAVGLASLAHPGLLGVLLAAFVMNYLLSFSMAFFPLYALAVGLSLTQISAVVGLHSFCQIVARPLSGEITRRLGHRGLVAGVVTSLAAAYTSIAVFDSFLPLAALFLLVGVLRAVGVVANTVSLAEDVPDDRLSRGVSSGLFNSAKDLGDISGPLLSGLVAAQIGLSGAFLLVPPVMLAVYGAGWIAVRLTVPAAARSA